MDAADVFATLIVEDSDEDETQFAYAMPEVQECGLELALLVACRKRTLSESVLTLKAIRTSKDASPCMLHCTLKLAFVVACWQLLSLDADYKNVEHMSDCSGSEDVVEDALEVPWRDEVNHEETTTVTTLPEAILQSVNGKLLSLSAIGEVANVDARRVGETVMAMASAFTCMQNKFLARLLNYVRGLQSMGSLSPVAYIVGRKYDETPLRSKVAWDAGMEIECGAKIMVLQREVSMLLAVKAAEQDHTVEYVQLHIPFASMMRAAKSMVGGVVRALVDLSMHDLLPRAARELFPQVIELSCTDEHGSNMVCERSRQCDVQGEGVILHTVCDVHKASALAKGLFSLQPELISGVIHTAKLLQEAAGTSILRSACIQIVHARMERRVNGGASETAKLYREHVQDVYLRGKRLHRVRSALTRLFNGDWQQDAMVHYCQGCCASHEDMLANVQKYVIQPLCQPVRIFPKNNWIGCDVTLDHLGIMLSLHGLLQKAVVLGFKLRVCEFPNEMEVEQNQELEPLDDTAAYHEESRKRRRIVAEFLLNKETTQNVLMFRTALEPQAELMRHSLTKVVPTLHF
eukprot:6477916-Amphidinium_carterae.2